MDALLVASCLLRLWICALDSFVCFVFPDLVLCHLVMAGLAW